jgi:hypothetical protein
MLKAYMVTIPPFSVMVEEDVIQNTDDMFELSDYFDDIVYPEVQAMLEDSFNYNIERIEND